MGGDRPLPLLEEVGWPTRFAIVRRREGPPHTREFGAATVMPARDNLYVQRLYKVVD